MKKVRDLTSEDVFEIWRTNEENRANWKEIYTHRGFASWEAWRKTYAEAFDFAKHEWALFEIKKK